MIIMENLPIKVKFLKQLHEHDFVEVGMIADLQKIEYDNEYDCYFLTFSFANYMSKNMPLFKEVYFPNIYTEELPNKELYTALEANQYTPKYTAYFDVVDDFNSEILDYLEVVL